MRRAYGAPNAFEEVNPDQFQALSGTILAGILGFFVLEKLLIWRHCHSGSCEAHGDDEHTQHNDHRSTGTLIIIGDSIHNFVDGVLIAAAFLTDVKLGIVTSLAVAAHEIPQEVGDFTTVQDTSILCSAICIKVMDSGIRILFI